MAAMDEATKQQIIELYQDHQVPVSEILQITGKSRSTIYWILQQNGIMPSRTRSKGEAQSGSPRQGTLQWALTRISELERENGQLEAQLKQAQSAFQELLAHFVSRAE